MTAGHPDDDDPRAALDAPPHTLARDVVPRSVGEALRILGRELRGTARAYLRMIEWPKDVSWKQVTLASIDRLSYAAVGVAVAIARAARRPKRTCGRS